MFGRGGRGGVRERKGENIGKWLAFWPGVNACGSSNAEGQNYRYVGKREAAKTRGEDGKICWKLKAERRYWGKSLSRRRRRRVPRTLIRRGKGPEGAPPQKGIRSRNPPKTLKSTLEGRGIWNKNWWLGEDRVRALSENRRSAGDNGRVRKENRVDGQGKAGDDHREKKNGGIGKSMYKRKRNKEKR